MLIAVRAEVEDVDAWREGFKTHGDLFRVRECQSHIWERLKVTLSLEFLRPMMLMSSSGSLMQRKQWRTKITGGVELFVLNETFSPKGMNKSIYRVILGYVAVVGSVLHVGNSRVGNVGFPSSSLGFVIVLLSLAFLGFLVVTDGDWMREALSFYIRALGINRLN